jgi:hypothetical protein
MAPEAEQREQPFAKTRSNDDRLFSRLTTYTDMAAGNSNLWETIKNAATWCIMIGVIVNIPQAYFVPAFPGSDLIYFCGIALTTTGMVTVTLINVVVQKKEIRSFEIMGMMLLLAGVLLFSIAFYLHVGGAFLLLSGTVLAVVGLLLSIERRKPIGLGRRISEIIEHDAKRNEKEI